MSPSSSLAALCRPFYRAPRQLKLPVLWLRSVPKLQLRSAIRHPPIVSAPQSGIHVSEQPLPFSGPSRTWKGRHEDKRKGGIPIREGCTLFVFLAEHRGSAHGPPRHSTAIFHGIPRATADTPRATAETPRASTDIPWASTKCRGK